MNALKREEILALAQRVRLVIIDGDLAYLNDLATDKELIAFVRLLEQSRLEKEQPR